ncbi:MAG: substrate-binding domain-containing protein [Bacillota bacterium]
MRLGKLIGIGLIILLIWLLFGGETGFSGVENKRIGIILLTREHQFFREMEESLLNEAKKNNFKIQVFFAEYAHNKQVELLDDFIAKKMDALILSPCDSKAIGEAIIKANEAGIPVFTVDIANLSGKGKVIAHIASDNFEGGRQAGRLMMEALKGKGKVVIINHPNITSTIDRVNGFREFLKDYPNIQIVADIPAWGQRSRAMSITEDLLLMMPDLNGIYAINDDSALGAATAIQAAGMTGKIVIVGYDGTPEARKAIDDGKIYGDVIQYPKEIGRLAIEAVSDYFQGKQVKPFIPVKVGVYTK